MGIGKDFTQLMREIRYDFIDVTFLETALTHSSYTNEMKQKGFRAESNEALEFLGDAVLEIVISEYLYDRYSKHGEGALSRLRQMIVCEATLSKIAFITMFFSGSGISLTRGLRSSFTLVVITQLIFFALISEPILW